MALRVPLLLLLRYLCQPLCNSLTVSWGYWKSQPAMSDEGVRRELAGGYHPVVKQCASNHQA